MIHSFAKNRRNSKNNVTIQAFELRISTDHILMKCKYCFLFKYHIYKQL
jgi:hypothetical protein